MESKTIELEHVGPITHLTIPIPEGGGVVVLRGRNGCGKSHALSGVESLYSQSTRKGMRNSDGVQSGNITGLGVSVRLGRSNTVKGELVCESLDGRVDPSILVDPGLKDPVKADAKRLESLVRLGGVRVSAERWSEAMADIEGEFSVVDLVDDDPVVTADRLRRRVHEIALTKEKLANSKIAEAAALVSSVADVQDEAIDEVSLDAELEEATVDLASSESMRVQYTLANARQMEARVKINSGEVIDTTYVAQELKMVSGELFMAKNDFANLKEELRAIQNRISAQTATLLNVTHRRDELAKSLEHAEQRNGDRQQFMEIIEAGLPATVTDDDHGQRMRRKTDARSAIQQALVVQRAIATRSKATVLEESASELTARADKFRRLARSTDAVLEQALIDAGFTTITVSDGRLCVDTDRGKEPFAELSHGERWRLALDLAASGMPYGSVLPVCQEAFESQDPENRRHINAMARERGLVIVTAEATDGELRAEVLS